MGFQSRSRSILSPSRTTTLYSCPSLGDSTSCDAGPCPAPDEVLGCLVTNWQGWSECSVTCGGSIYTRSRTVTRPAINGGTACPTTFETSVCSPTECPVDCQVASWTIWGSCSYAQSPLCLLRPPKPSCNEFPSYCAILILARILLSQSHFFPSSSCGVGSTSRSRAISRSVGGGGRKYARKHSRLRAMLRSCENGFAHHFQSVQLPNALRGSHVLDGRLPRRLCHNQLDSMEYLRADLWECE